VLNYVFTTKTARPFNLPKSLLQIEQNIDVDCMARLMEYCWDPQLNQTAVFPFTSAEETHRA